MSTFLFNLLPAVTTRLLDHPITGCHLVFLDSITCRATMHICNTHGENQMFSSTVPYNSHDTKHAYTHWDGHVNSSNSERKSRHNNSTKKENTTKSQKVVTPRATTRLCQAPFSLGTPVLHMSVYVVHTYIHTHAQQSHVRHAINTKVTALSPKHMHPMDKNLDLNPSFVPYVISWWGVRTLFKEVSYRSETQNFPPPLPIATRA